MFQDASQRIFLNPVALCLLLNRLAFCDSEISRLENRVRVGSTVTLRNVFSQEVLTLRIVKDEKARPAEGIVSFTSIIGVALLGLRSGDVAQVRTAQGEFEWELVAVVHSATNLST